MNATAPSTDALYDLARLAEQVLNKLLPTALPFATLDDQQTEDTGPLAVSGPIPVKSWHGMDMQMEAHGLFLARSTNRFCLARADPNEFGLFHLSIWAAQTNEAEQMEVFRVLLRGNLSDDEAGLPAREKVKIELMNEGGGDAAKTITAESIERLTHALENFLS